MKRFTVLVSLAVLLGVGAIYFSSISSASFVWNISQGGQLLLPLVAIAALVDSINPCAISVLLLTIAFLFGLGRLRSSILKTGFFYILGIFIVYILIGLGILQALHIFGVPHFMAKVGAALLIALGAVGLLNEFYPSFPIKLGIPHSAHKKMAELMEKGSVPTAFVLGVFVGLCEFPCTGGPYLVVLGLLHDSPTYWLGLGYLVLYNLIFVLPLVVLLLIASDKVLLTKVQEWKKTNVKGMRFWGSIAMILLGLFIFMI
ncbi:MAG: hypothetical protein COX15_00960 [Candidatus Colwellbacteria bacterium CG23_combo_of_CG06-09_8_20_14_all_42_19]|uniref:Uncharacterized protein n=1 Tax=Candidatus Colwellbacteria bacterium CG23_combo_of_CG06-09_8_20_14_all_42_19 TaxID=1974541 RepID=A0A2H0ALN7_9BACT|nr:MAG: hypothetical protein COX15_00960 [Candidatus Colwellbacteria bacterium CG23_combo_of_CG06-09_8_20_14_all_42_19]